MMQPLPVPHAADIHELMASCHFIVISIKLKVFSITQCLALINAANAPPAKAIGSVTAWLLTRRNDTRVDIDFRLVATTKYYLSR